MKGISSCFGLPEERVSGPRLIRVFMGRRRGKRGGCFRGWFLGLRAGGTSEEEIVETPDQKPSCMKKPSFLPWREKITFRGGGRRLETWEPRGGGGKHRARGGKRLARIVLLTLGVNKKKRKLRHSRAQRHENTPICWGEVSYSSFMGERGG